MTDIELLPCPFCGGRADIVRGGADEEIWPHRAFSRAFCTGCQARQLFHKTDADAAAAWNIRANVAHHTAAKDAEIEALRSEVELQRELSAQHAREAVFWERKHVDSVSRAERLAEALRPLANLDLRPDGFDKRPDDQTIYARDRTTITVGDVRRAQAALRDHD